MSEDNPLENADVKALLADADNINSKHDFQNWQKSFLDAFTKFLDSKGSDKAKEAYDKFSNSSGGLFKIVKSLTKHIEDGAVSKEHASVKGRRAITELGTVLNKLVEALQLILPTTSMQITKFGFTKYHMGAVLVEDGFKEYAVMQFCKKLLQHLRVQALDDIASQQVLEEIDYFGKKFDVFCGVMESLNLMNVCKIAEKFLHSEFTDETNKVLGSAAGPAATKSTTPLPEKKKEFAFTVTYPEGSQGAKKPSDITTQQQNMVDRKFNPSEKNKKQDEDSVSSYEEIEEVITVSSYETVEMEDDSSYETLQVVEESEYETDEEEVVVSDYVTDSDESEAGKKVKKKPKPKKKSRDDKPVAKKKPSKSAPAPAKPKAAPAAGKPNKGGNKSQPKKAAAKKAAPPPGQSNGLPPPGHNNEEGMDEGQQNSEQEEEQDSNNSSDSGKEHKDRDLFHYASDSDSSGQGNIKVRAPKAPGSAPPSPTANEKPVQRISFSSKDFYHGHSNNNDCFNAWKLYKKDKNGESEHDRQKKMKRIERVEIVTTRRKVKERQVKTVRQKKDKPPKMVRVRNTHQVVQKKRVKKDKPQD